MLRISLISLLIASSSLFAHYHFERDIIGTAMHHGQASVTHDGDFVDFALEFSAACYDQQEDARRAVIANVDRLLVWLNTTVISYDANLDHHVDLIYVWRNENSYGEYTDLCKNKHYARQNVSIRVNRLPEINALNDEMIQNIFEDLQGVIALANYTNADDVNSWVGGQIASVQKGIFAETAEVLRIQAKAKAQARATRDFLAFLGPNYTSWWRLQSVDFTASNPYGLFIPQVVEPRIGGNIADGISYSVIRLEPITVSVDGNFVFHFEAQNNYLPNE